MPRVRGYGRHLWIVICVIAPLLLAACSSSTPENAINILKAHSDVNPSLAHYIGRGISAAENAHAKLVVIELDTPGGDETSMRQIVQDIEAATVPVAVYVYPSGARAASAGTFITMAANIAAMSPSTEIGAASPINANGSNITGTLGKKVMNDAVAFIQSIAILRGRNATWAAQAVRDAVSVDAETAVSMHVVDFQANSLHDLLHQAEGRSVTVAPNRKVTLTNLESAPVTYTSMSFWEQLINFLSDPTLATILIGLGFVALIIELFHPGLIAPGVLGAVAVILGFLGLGELGVNTAGLVILAIGLLCLALEIFFPSGILGGMGVLALIVGALITFHGAPAGATPSIALLVVLGVFAVGMVAAMAVTVTRLRQHRAVMGTNALLGKIAVARTPLTPDGYVFIQGERWRAHLEEGTAQQGDRLRIVGAEGFRLRVTKEQH